MSGFEVFLWLIAGAIVVVYASCWFLLRDIRKAERARGWNKNRPWWKP